MPQLNFTIPADLLDRIDAAKPNYLDRKGFLCLLLDQALDTPSPTPYDLGKGGRGVGVENPEVLREEGFISSSSIEEEKINPKRRAPKQVSDAPRKRFIFSIPDDLADYKADLLCYWREDKAGKKSESAAKTLISSCRAIRDRYGDKVLRSQIELARGYGWENITLSNYEKFGLPRSRGGAPAQPEHKHPAAREFRNGRFVDEPTTGGVLEGLF